MKSLGPFVLGLLLGAFAMWFVTHYYVIRAHDGVTWVRKISPQFPESIYVDVRAFGFQEWSEHPRLAYALTNAGRTDLLKGVAIGPLQQAANNILNQVNQASGQVRDQLGIPQN